MAKRTLSRSLQYLDWRHIARALFAILAENKKWAKISGMPPDDDDWHWAPEFRADLLCRAKNHWCHATGRSRGFFPYSEDFVARLYARLSKLSAAKRKEYKKEMADVVSTE